MFKIVILIILVIIALYLSRIEGFKAAEGPSSNLLISDESGNIAGIPFPKGMIMLWYGSASNIPAGWALCDGGNGTPDLRGRFVLGINPNSNKTSANSVIEFKATGGNSEQKPVLTLRNLPAHTHNYNTGNFWAACAGGSKTDVTNDNRDVQNTSGVAGASSPQPIKIPTLPPYFVLAYIMKVI